MTPTHRARNTAAELPSARFGVSVWASDAWRAEATAWMDTQLAEAGSRRTGAVEQPHLRSWATALTAPTTSGRVWLKAPGPGTAFEVPLYELINRREVAGLLTPLAVDTEHSWLLLPDGGRLLADVVDAQGLADALCAVLPYYSQLQLDLTEAAPELLEAGVADMRPEVLPARFDEALAATAAYVRDAQDPAATAAHQALVDLRDDYRERCEALAAGPIGATLQHDDLHQRNIFVDEDLRPRFFDWGDSVIGHPFASMLVTLRALCHVAQSRRDSPTIRRVRDAYLEPFSALAPHAQLVEQLELACHLGKVSRSLSWAKVVAGLPADEAQEDASAPFEWLCELLVSSYLGSIGDGD